MAFDDKALEALAEALEELGTVPSQAAAEASEKIEALIQQQFDEGKGPDGETWEPLATGEASYLERTGDLRASVEVRPSQGAGIEITIGTDYASFHQTGTSRMPARKILPETELPEEWTGAIDVAVDRAARRRLRKFSP